MNDLAKEDQVIDEMGFLSDAGKAFKKVLNRKNKRIAELKKEMKYHLLYLWEYYPDVYQDPYVPAFEDYNSEGDGDDSMDIIG